jgi:uncharacterized protein (TIGR03435 family)
MAKAGELAPEITVTKVIRSPGNAVWKQANLIGRLTMVVFFPDVSSTTDAFLSFWNDLVRQFAEKQTQFLLIARDKEPDLVLWLREHTFQGWLLLDSNWDIARTWGIFMPQTAFIDNEARILGFSGHPLPSGWEIEKILTGRVAKAHLRAKPRSPDGDKPEVPPSYTVHISPTSREPEEGTSASGGPDHWTRLGFELRVVIGEVYGIAESRIDLPASLDNGQRYDFAVLLPEEKSQDAINILVQQAIEQYFHVTITSATRLMNVYILTAPKGMGPSMQDAEFTGGGFMSFGTGSYSLNPDAEPPLNRAEFRKANVPIRHISASGMAIAELCSAMEPHLDRLVIDETGLGASYNFQILASGDNTEDFLQALRDQLGIVATPSQRDVTMLVVSQSLIPQ